MKTTLNKILDRIADVFSVFDFSFIISGMAAFIMIYTFLSFSYREALLLIDSNNSWIFIIFIIYILGLIMFALGVCTIMQKQDVGIEASASKRVSYGVFLFP